MPNLRSLAAMATVAFLQAVLASADDPAPAHHEWKARVVDADGKPIAHARAHLGWEARPGKGSLVGTDVRNGILSIEAEDPDRTIVSVRVFAAEDDRGSPLNLAPVTVETPFARSESEVVIRMEKPGLITEGVVLDAAGKGVVGVHLFAIDDRPEERDKPATGGRATTDAKGKFRIVGLGSGPYLLDVGHLPAFAPHDSVATRGGESGVEIRLNPGVSPTVTVLDEDGKPIAGARVRAWPTQGPMPFEATSGADGRARLEGMIPKVAARLEVDPPPARKDELEALRTEDWQPQDETVRLHAAKGR